MLLRLLSALFRREAQPHDSSAGAKLRRTGSTMPGIRGAAVMPDGSARPAVRIRADSPNAGNVPVESNPELRSAALFQSHYLPQVPPDTLSELHRRYGRMLAAEVAGSAIRLRAVDADPRRRIRIGYVSPNLASHSVSYFIEPVLANHDRVGFEVYCYHTGADCDETTERIESSVDVWRQVHALPDDALARLIADDRIDVAIDLAGHTVFGRLAVFARRPAPVQMTWLGYPDTTGLEAIDYRITDDTADPAPQADARYTERLLRIPGVFVCYQPPLDAPEVAPRDSAPDEVVFCSFNTAQKVNDSVFALWSRVLRAVPGSRLLIKGGRLLEQDAVVQRMRSAFNAHGIADARVDLRGWIEDRAEHLALYGAADIALDTWPYNGTTTTCEAMWMGVPVVTLVGEAHMSRVGASLLGAVGLNELVAHTPDDYVAAAVSLARDAPRRRELRAGLRPKFAASPLLDHSGFTRKLEGRIRETWIEWCSRPQR
jgi:predicted O-linked N-acetylglucosamine transferase (SPINDLY family)